MELTVFISIDGDLPGPAPKNRPFARRDLRYVPHVARGHEIGVLRGDIQVLLCEFLDGAERLAGGIVQASPVIIAAQNEIREQDSGDRPVRHSVPGVPGRDEDILAVEGIAPDKRETIDRFHDLSRPLKLERCGRRETFTRPSLQPFESLLAVVGLARFVVFAAHNQHVLTLVEALDAEIVIRIRSVPDQDLWHGATRYSSTYHEGPVRGLFRVNRH